MLRAAAVLILRSCVCLALLLGVCPSGTAQSVAGWKVRPEWVKAHEDFLASDTLAGRGSATRDEHLAALYVATEFEQFGLQMAPGMTSYLQEAPLEVPALDAHATLTSGSTTLHEGADFDLLQSPAVSVDGALVKVTLADVGKKHVAHGAAVLLAGATTGQEAFQASARLRREGASIVLLDGEGEIAELYSKLGSHTHTPIHLQGETQRGSMTTVAVLRPARFAQMQSEAEGTAVHLSVSVVAATEPRLTYNAVGYLPGTDPSAGTLLLTAHLDHLGVGRPINGDTIYNGANDDAAGTTAVLELAHALASGDRPRRNVLFVCYGSEEMGELGSTYFGAHAPVALKDLIANLEFEMIGNQDPKMPKGVLLLTGWERSDLGPALKAHGALVGPDPYPEQHFFERSDNYALALKGVVAHTAAGWGTPPTYHQPSDDLAHLDFQFMTAAIQSLVEPVRWLASSDFVPHWTKGGRPKE